jgi:RNA-directed DNA polymerase
MPTSVRSLFAKETVEPPLTEEKQMMKEQSFGASSDIVSDWQAVDWPKVRHNVRRLQLRIAKAIRAGKHGSEGVGPIIMTH